MLIPLYLVVLCVAGLVSGRVSDFSGLDARLGIVAVVVCAVLGTLLVIPTGGEIPVIRALSATGVLAGLLFWPSRNRHVAITISRTQARTLSNNPLY